MSFNKRKYYFILAFVFVLMFLGCTLNMLFDVSAEINTNPPIIEPEPEPEPDEPVKVYKNGYELWAYANDVWQNGAGYKATYTQDIVTPVLGHQEIYSIRQRNGDERLDTTWSRADNDRLVNMARTIYVAPDGVSGKFSQSRFYNYKEDIDLSKSHELCLINYPEYLDEYLFYAHGLNLDITPKNSKLVSFHDYVLKVELSHENVNLAYYIDYVRNGMIAKLEYTSFDVTITFSKTTNYIKRIEINEEYTIDLGEPYSFLKGITCKGKTTFTFMAMNKAQDITDPFLAIGF